MTAECTTPTTTAGGLSTSPCTKKYQPGYLLGLSRRGRCTGLPARVVHCGQRICPANGASAPTKQVMSVARYAAFNCRARRRSGALSLKCTSICVSTPSCHHFSFVHAESALSGSIFRTSRRVLRHSNGAFRRQSTRLQPIRAKTFLALIFHHIIFLLFSCSC